jgi:HEPN domain-containing protein
MARAQPHTTKVAADPKKAEAAIKAARMWHAAASLLEKAGEQQRRPAVCDLAWLDRIMGATSGAVVLEALAVELALKARLYQAGIKVTKDHNHSLLFGKLPDTEKKAIEQQYVARRNNAAFRATLADVLSYSAETFQDWRYMHEKQGSVQASLGEMQRAFAALADGTAYRPRCLHTANRRPDPRFCYPVDG